MKGIPIGRSGPTGLLIVFVSLEASALRLVLDDGEPVWQRPIGGWTLLPGRSEATTKYTLEFYDTAGATIEVHSR